MHKILTCSRTTTVLFIGHVSTIIVTVAHITRRDTLWIITLELIGTTRRTCTQVPTVHFLLTDKYSLMTELQHFLRCSRSVSTCKLIVCCELCYKWTAMCSTKDKMGTTYDLWYGGSRPDTVMCSINRSIGQTKGCMSTPFCRLCRLQHTHGGSARSHGLTWSQNIRLMHLTANAFLRI